MAENISNISCSEEYDRGLLWFRCSLSMVSNLFILGMLLIIIIFKKYHFFSQRLVLYLAISTLTYQVISALDVTSIKAYSDSTALGYCVFIGFMTQMVLWWPVMATAIIALDIFVRVVLKKETERLELLYVLLIFGFSAIFNWIPFVYSAFGPARYFCWIRIVNLEDCSQFSTGIILRSVLFFFPVYLIVLVMIVLLVMTAIFLWRWRKSYEGNFDPKAVALKKKMAKEIRPLLYYPIIFIVSTIISVIITVYSAVPNGGEEHAYIVISVMNSIVFRLQGVFITLVFTLDPETRKKLNFMDIKSALNRFCEKEKNADYPAHYNARSDSLHCTSFESTTPYNIDKQQNELENS